MQPGDMRGHRSRRNATRPQAVAACVGLLLLALAGCAAPQSAPLQLTEKVERPEASVLVLLVDGMDKARFDDCLSRGLLPHIERHFVRGGVGVERAIVSMPAITYANAVSLITGCFPGRHGVLGNCWFDRDQRLLRDYGSATTYRYVNSDFDQPTWYEVLDEPFTVSVQTHTDRGVDAIVDNWVTSGLDWAAGAYAQVDARVGTSAREIVTLAEREGRWPVLYFSYFPGLDEIGHRFGADSPEYQDALIEVDRAIGTVVDTVAHLAPADRIYHILTTDHGHIATPPGHALDLAAWLTVHAGRRVFSDPLQGGWRSWRALRLDRYDTVLTVDAGRRAAVHLCGRAGWDGPPNPADIEALFEAIAAPGGLIERRIVDTVCMRADGDAVVFQTAASSGRIERRTLQGQREYRVVALPSGASRTADPFVAHDFPSGWHTARAWLAMTASADRPDFVPQVVEMFDAPRAGDLVLFAAGDWSFDGRYRGAHGSCLSADMCVPLYFAGPELLAGGRIPYARLVDVYPTVLDLLGVSPAASEAPPIDGASLVPQLWESAAP